MRARSRRARLLGLLLALGLVCAASWLTLGLSAEARARPAPAGMLWRAPATPSEGMLGFPSLFVAGSDDLDGDARADALLRVTGWGGAAFVEARSGADGATLWRVGAPPRTAEAALDVSGLATLPDLDGDGRSDVLLTWREGFGLVSGASGRWIRRVPLELGWVRELLAVEDQDADGVGDFLALCQRGEDARVELRSSASGALLWSRRREDLPAESRRVLLHAEPRLALLRGAQQGERLALALRRVRTRGDEGVGEPGFVELCDLRTHERLWRVEAPDLGFDWPWGLASAGDLDGDGLEELAVGGDGRIELRSGADGRLLREIIGPRGAEWGEELACVRDFDGDGACELLVSARSAPPGRPRACAGSFELLSLPEGRRLYSGALLPSGTELGLGSVRRPDGTSDLLLAYPDRARELLEESLPRLLVRPRSHLVRVARELLARD